MTNYNFRFHSEAEATEFITYIKDAVVQRISYTEKFSAIRLSNSRITVGATLRGHWLGRAHSTGLVEIKGSEEVLDLAATVIHEMGHVLVGGESNHDSNWADACKMLGLLDTSPSKMRANVPEDFDSDMLREIENAIHRFAREHPALTYLADSIPKPDSQTEDYLPFQVEGIKWMLRNPKNILLADEMGLGKTVEVMGYINVAKPSRILIACPNNAKLIWKRHFEQWCIHKYSIEMGNVKIYFFKDKEMHVVIMSYEAMARWHDALASQHWDLFASDEAHYVKNPSAKRSKAVFGIKADKKILITGTPIVNYPYELFPLIHYLDRETWPELGRFERNYGARGTGRFGHNLNRLNMILRDTIMLRRFKKDVLPQLPKKRRQVYEFVPDEETRKLIEEEQALYDKMMGEVDAAQAQWLAAMKNESDVTMNDVDWAALIESLQTTKRYSFERMSEIAHKIGICKLPLAIEHLEDLLEAEEKVVVFGHHRDVLSAVAKHFEPHSVLVLGGNIDQGAVTQAAAEKFNNDPDCRLFVGGISLAAGYSLKGSSTVIFIEQGWIPGLFTQAEDRCHGIGRGEEGAKSMLIQHLVYEDSLDTKKAQMAIKKQKSIDRATGGVKL